MFYDPYGQCIIESHPQKRSFVDIIDSTSTTVSKRQSPEARFAQECMDFIEWTIGSVSDHAQGGLGTAATVLKYALQGGCIYFFRHIIPDWMDANRHDKLIAQPS